MGGTGEREVFLETIFQVSLYVREKVSECLYSKSIHHHHYYDLCTLKSMVAMKRKTMVHEAEMIKPMATSKWCSGSQPR